ncbi:MAG: hypothetical protein R2867_17310 [Caldilineaceae bacterium]
MPYCTVKLLAQGVGLLHDAVDAVKAVLEEGVAGGVDDLAQPVAVVAVPSVPASGRATLIRSPLAS